MPRITEPADEQANNRYRVRVILPTLRALVNAQFDYIAADGAKAMETAKAMRNALAASLKDDDLNTARMFVASLGALLQRHI